MKAEIISVGTELLLGHVINSDAAYVARLLAETGITITNMQVVGDNPERLKSALHLAAGRADIVITTGGLGPTKDDLTREICADFVGKRLVLHQELAVSLKKFFENATYTENQERQAYAPADATIIPNGRGTAPGLIIPFDKDKLLILLPGPPVELLPMLEDFVKPFLARLSREVIHSRIVRVFGRGEGEVDTLLAHLLDTINPTVAPYAANGEMFVKITARAADQEEAVSLIEPVLQEIENTLGSAIYGIDVTNLEELVVKRLIKNKLTVATAESCTGGLLAKRITDQPGASAVFPLGLITYANEAKINLLGISPALLNDYGAVSEPVAKSMAENVRELAKTDYGIGITGIAGPDGGTPEKPLGLVYVSLASDRDTIIHKIEPKSYYRGRAWVRTHASSYALYMLNEILKSANNF